MRQLGVDGEIPVVLLDATPEAVAELEAGRIESIVSSDAEAIGAEAVQAAVDGIDGEETPPEILLDGCIITEDTLDDPKNAPCLYGE